MAYISLPVNFYRLNAEPLDTSSVFTTFDQLTSYASTSPAAYSGQICSVPDEGAYILKTNKTVEKLGAGGSSNTIGLSATRSFVDASGYINIIVIENGLIKSWSQLPNSLTSPWNDNEIWDDLKLWIES